MKKLSLRSCATGLVTVAIVTGLSFTPGAAVHAAASDAAVDAVGDVLAGPFLADSWQASNFVVAGEPTAGASLERAVYQDLDAARAAAATWTFPGLAKTGQVRGTGAASNVCLQVSSAPDETVLVPQTCADRPSQKFSWVDVDGGKTLVSAAAPRTYLSTSSATGTFVLHRSASRALTFRTDELTRPFTAAVDAVDVAARTADISGRAVPGAYVLVDGRDQVQAADDGTWHYRLTDLSLGVTSISLEQWEGTTKTGEVTLDVTLPVASVTASVRFPTDTSKPAVVSGGAQPGAEVVVTDAAGAELARTTAQTGSGSWSAALPAPGTGGDRPVRVFQLVDGEKNGEIGVTVAYGAGVSVTSPADGAAHDGGRLRMSGRGEAGASVTIREQGSDDVIGTATVLVSGNWNATITGLDSRRHVLEAAQAGRGANTTVASVTINPDGTGVEQPFELTSPKDGDTVVAPTNDVDFTGLGTTGDTVQIRNTWNDRLVTSATVDESGTWSARGQVGNGTQHLEAVVTHGGTSTHHPFTITVRKSAGVERPFAVTDPADGSTVVAPQQRVTFSGTGTTGAQVVLKAGSGRTVVDTVVREDGTWSYTGGLNWQFYVLDTIYTVPGSAPVTGTMSLTVVQTPGVEKPFAVTTPADGSVVIAPDRQVRFSGTGTTGAQVVLTAGNGREVVKTVVREDGTWSYLGQLAYQTYVLDTTYTVPGSAPVRGTHTVTVQPGDL